MVVEPRGIDVRQRGHIRENDWSSADGFEASCLVPDLVGMRYDKLRGAIQS